MLKKILSILLSLCILFGVLTVLPISASAKDTDIAESGVDISIAETGVYQSDAVQWIKDRGNEGWWDDVDGAYGCQCVDLIMAYYQYFGYSRMSGNAYQYQWDHIPSGSGWYYSGSPIPGSIFVKGQGGYYDYGHVGLVYDVDGSTMYTVETNLESPYDGGRYYAKAQFRTRSVSFATTFINPVFDTPPDPIPQGHVMSESEGAGQTIPDGDYWINSKLGENYFVDIPGNDFNTYDKQNVQTWIWDSGLPPVYDVFHITYLNNGFYKITQKNTNMAIDLYGGYLERGSNVSMWTYSGSEAQQWSIEKTSGGYRIRSRGNNYYMDINDGAYANGTNILTWESHDGNNQRFSFIPYAPDEKPLSNGIYEIRSAVNQNAFLDAIGIPRDFKDPTNVDIWNGTDGEKFQIEYAENGYYFISEVVSGLVLDLNNDGEFSFLKNGRNINLCAKNYKKNQLWKIRKNTDGTFFFINQMSGYYLDLENAKTDNGTNVSQYQYNGNKNQRWIPIRVLQNDMVTVKDVVTTSSTTSVNPAVTVKVDGKTLTKNTDYTVDVTADIANGTGTVTVTGKGNYCGKVKKTFKITVDDSNTIIDAQSHQYKAEKDEIVTYIIDLTSQRQVNHLSGVLYYNQEQLEPIITDDMSYHAPSFKDGQFRIYNQGQIEFDVYNDSPVSLNNTTVVKMQFRVIGKGTSGWLSHEFRDAEFSWDNIDNYGLETRVLTDQELYVPKEKILGDVDGDEETTVLDATYIQRYDAGFDVPISEEDILLRGDVDGDEEVTVIDATYIQRFDAGFNIPYPVGEAIA